MLSRLAREFVHQRAKPFANNEFGKFVRHDIALEARKNLIFLPYDLKVKASVGAGNWASVPWLGFFDPLITESATQGFYIVYLINPISEEIFLSLNQGTTVVYQEFGETRGQEVLRRRAVDIATRIPEFAKLFEIGAIDLGSKESLPAGYEAGHAFGRKYKAFKIKKSSFYEDLKNMISAYQALVDRGGTTPFDVMHEDSGSNDIEETRRYILSKRIERAAKVRDLVLEKRGSRCEGCSLDPVIHFAYSGPLKNMPLDVHHSKPIRELAEGESRRYRIPDDFLVLCPTCHRLIHKQANPGDLDVLKSTVKFVYAMKKPKDPFHEI